MNIAVAQSGGPTSAINSSLIGVFREAVASRKIQTVFGALNGIEGIIKDRLVNLSEVFATKEQEELAVHTPSTLLGSCRYKLPPAQSGEELYKTVTDCFHRHGIEAFFYIGGNDSMDTVAKLSAYMEEKGETIRIIGIPKTIDNDLCLTDHTPGFGSAAKYVAATMEEIGCDSAVYAVPSVTVVEIMGRHAGWLTASSCLLHANGLSAPHLIYLPEVPFDTERFIGDVTAQMQRHKAVVVAVSEGIRLNGERCGRGERDIFGHELLSGIGKQLENLVRSRIGCKVRSVELNVMQRCSSHIASRTDLEEAAQIGAAGVRCALAGNSGRMMAFRRISDAPYRVEIVSVPAWQAANAERKFPTEWITPEGNQVTEQATAYFMPLIQGECIPFMENGMPRHFTLSV